MATSSMFRRLPSLHSAAAVQDYSAVQDASGTTKNLRTATSRYRHDPYRANVTSTAPASDAPQPIVPMPPADPSEKIAAGPRRGQPLPVRGGALPAIGGSLPPPPPPPPVAPRPQQQRSRRSSFSGQPPRPSDPDTAADLAATTVDQSGPDNRGASKIALIQFKRTMMSALYDSVRFGDLAVGDAVIVEGDRGEHIATIARVNVRKSKSTPTMIMRRAVPADFQQHVRVKEDEAIALEACRAHAQRLNLQNVMTIVDVEFQLDFQKLTVFFQPKDPSNFVDFRSLQRALYQHFRCRIWIVDC